MRERSTSCARPRLVWPAGRASAARPASAGTELDDGFLRSVAGFIAELGYEPVRANGAGHALGLNFAIANSATSLFGIRIECDAPRNRLLA